MTAPDPQHIDAVAQTIDPAAWEEGGWLRKATKPVAARLLDSTDPAVHAAMLDALTRHGALTRAWTVIGNDDEGEEWIVDALWAERDEAEQWARTHGGHAVGRLHEADWHEVAP